MSSKSSKRAEAQARAAQLRAAQQRKDKQRTQIIVAITAAVVVLIGFAIVLAVSSSKKNETSTATGQGAQAVIGRITSVPESAFEAAGVPDNAKAAGSVPVKLADGKPVITDGKPTVTYVGALFCPYCGTHRWATIVALSRFGTFSGLAEHRSGESQIPTFTFKDVKYDSKYLVFQAFETRDDQGNEIATLPDAVKAAFEKYDAPPYVDEKSKGSIPWTYYGTHAQAGGPGPTQELAALDGDDAWDKVSQEVATGQGTIGKGIDAEANMMTAQICQLTKGEPGNVCTSKPVVEAGKLIEK